MKKYCAVSIVLVIFMFSAVLSGADEKIKKDWRQIYLPEGKIAKPLAADKSLSINRKIFGPVTKAGLKELFASRIVAFDKLYKDGRWRLYPKSKDRDVRTQSSVMMYYAVDYKFTERKENLAKIASSFNWVYDNHWNKKANVLFNGHYYLPNAVWSTFMAIVLEEVGDELPKDLRLKMEKTLRGSAVLCAGRSTGGKPSNTVVCNQDFWAVHGLLLVSEYLKEKKHYQAALKKLGYISLFEQQGFECEFGVGPLYQAVGRPGCAEVGYRLWDILNYRGRSMLLDTSLVHLIATTSTTGRRRLGLENQRSSGFGAALSPCFLPAAIKQKNPFVTWSALNVYHLNQKKAHSGWWLLDPVPAICMYQFYKYGHELDASNQEQWIISWGAKGRFTATLGRHTITDEQSYIRSRTGLTAHFADRRLSSPNNKKRDIQWNPGGLRHLARGDDVIVAPSHKLSMPRLRVSGLKMGDSEYVGSTMYRGVFASQYTLRQNVISAKGEKLLHADNTFLALDDLLIANLRYTPLVDIKKPSAYRITHLRSQNDKTGVKGRYILSQLATSVGGGKPGSHAILSLDGKKILQSNALRKPASNRIIKDTLSQWVVPFSRWSKDVSQTRLIAVKPFATGAETEKILATLKSDGTCMSLESGGKKYYLLTGVREFSVTVDGYEFVINASNPKVINVFAFNASGKLDGFSVYGKQCSLDGAKLFESKTPSYVSLTALAGRYYASSDRGKSEVVLHVKHNKQWSLISGKPTETIRNGEIVVGK